MPGLMLVVPAVNGPCPSSSRPFHRRPSRRAGDPRALGRDSGMRRSSRAKCARRRTHPRAGRHVGRVGWALVAAVVYLLGVIALVARLGVGWVARTRLLRSSCDCGGRGGYGVAIDQTRRSGRPRSSASPPRVGGAGRPDDGLNLPSGDRAAARLASVECHYDGRGAETRARARRAARRAHPGAVARPSRRVLVQSVQLVAAHAAAATGGVRERRGRARGWRRSPRLPGRAGRLLCGRSGRRRTRGLAGGDGARVPGRSARRADSELASGAADAALAAPCARARVSGGPAGRPRRGRDAGGVADRSAAIARGDVFRRGHGRQREDDAGETPAAGDESGTRDRRLADPATNRSSAPGRERRAEDAGRDARSARAGGRAAPAGHSSHDPGRHDGAARPGRRGPRAGAVETGRCR